MYESELKKVFGLEGFRLGQAELVEAAVRARDILAIMPTGSGKSLCFQLPALLQKGATLVVTPLIALMEDQDRRATENGMKATYLSHSLGKSEIFVRCANAVKEPPDLFYVAPERLDSDGFGEVLKRMPIARVVVDEAHCLDQYIEFRPAYSKVGGIVDQLGVPVSAFTATATERTRELIRTSLRMDSPFVHIASMDRPNLRYEVHKKWPQDVDQIHSLITYSVPNGGSGIVYRTTRKEVESTWRSLVGMGVDCLPYHAGMKAETRSLHQTLFIRGKCPIIISTIAFGMGIDKPDVRWVIHGDMPTSLEGYFQESGRAGRDGLPATCYMLFDVGDIPKVRSFADNLEGEGNRKLAYDRIRAVMEYGAAGKGCRRWTLLKYFGECENCAEVRCGNCDLCGKVER